MKDAKYQKWIDQYAEQKNISRLRGSCVMATKEIMRAFPELRTVVGFVFPIQATPEHIQNSLPTASSCLEDRRMAWDLYLGPEQHCWCIDPEGNIVDPTKAQYEEWTGIQYVEFSEEVHGPMPSGKCIDCGELLFGTTDFCNEQCQQATEDYLRREAQRART